MKAFGTCTPYAAGVSGYDLKLDFNLVPQTKCLYGWHGSKLSSLCLGPLCSH